MRRESYDGGSSSCNPTAGASETPAFRSTHIKLGLGCLWSYRHDPLSVED